MDTTANVSEFKIAKVGEGRKRRGGGLPLFGGATKGGGAFSGALGGSGAAAGVGLAGKIGVIALVATLSAGAWQVGKSLRPDENIPAAKSKPKVFASADQKYSAEEMANVLTSNHTTMPNSLGFVSGSMDGMSAEERAKKEAEAAAAARAAEEENKKAEAEASKAPADVAGAPAGVDPNALMQGVAGEKKDEKAGTFGKKMGALSTSFGGGGLAGGGGMAGGVGRGFANADFGSKGGGGKIASMRSGSNPSISKAAGARPGASNTRGFARRQLSNAFALSRQAASAGKGETSAQAASSAFDNNAGQGNIISGSGVGEGGAPAGASTGGSVNPDSGGPINPDADTNSTPNEEGKNVTKWQGLVDTAKMMLAIMTVLGLLAWILEKTGYGLFLLPAIYGAIMALGAVVTLLGVAIMGHGQYLQGGILTAIGAISCYLAYQQYTADANTTAQVAAKSLVGQATTLLGGAGLGFASSGS